MIWISYHAKRKCHLADPPLREREGGEGRRKIERRREKKEM